MNDPITEAVVKMISSIPVADLEDKPLMLAFLNWFASQDVEQEDMCCAITTLLGLFIGMRSTSQADMKERSAIFAKQMRSAAAVSMEHKELAGER
jgi:hypothetical protein